MLLILQLKSIFLEGLFKKTYNTRVSKTLLFWLVLWQNGLLLNCNSQLKLHFHCDDISIGFLHEYVNSGIGRFT